MAEINTGADLKERGYSLLIPPVTVVALDPAGDGADYDGLVAISREEYQRGAPHDPDFSVEMLYRVLLAHRLPQNWEFPEKLAAVLSLDRFLRGLTHQRRQHSHIMCFETNGVGYGYASSFARKSPTKVIGYATVARKSTTGVAPVNAKIAMPRLEALDNTRILLETGYLKLAEGAPGIDTLRKEMRAFVWRGRNRPEAMSGQHDDLVMAMTGALWVASKVLPPVLKQVKLPAGTRHDRRPERMRIQ